MQILIVQPARIVLCVFGFCCLVGSATARAQTAATNPATTDFDRLLPHIPVVPPAETIKNFRIEPGFKIELAAAEPQVCDPIDIAFDERGRMYVCELWNYPGVPKAGEKLGRIRRLTSSRNDGIYDQSTIFAENLRWPSGIICWEGGVYVISNPDIWYLKDTGESGKADLLKKVFTGLAGETYEVGNSLRWGPDNRIYVCGSYAGGTLRRADTDDRGQHSRDFRFDPRTNVCEAVSGAGEWGATFNDWGDRFTCDATHFVHHAVLPREDLAGNPYLAVPSVQEDCIPNWTHVFPVSPPEPWKVVRQEFWKKWVGTNADMNPGRFPKSELAPQGFATSACGLTIFRGSAFPDGYNGCGFIGEPANNLVVRLQLIEQDGPEFLASRSGNPSREFLASTDNRFRPVNFANGPDGCLYVVSMYREIIEDETAIPDDILKHYDLYSGRDLGRIYRVMPEHFQPGPIPRLDGAATRDLVSLLAHGDSWVRETAQRLLYQRQDHSAAADLRKLVADGPTPQSRIQALWTLQGIGELDESSISHAAVDSDGHVREAAVVLSRAFIESSASLRTKIMAMAGDDSGRVRFRVAFALADCNDPAAVAALVRIARRDAADRWTRTAVASAVPRQSGALMGNLLADEQFLANDGAAELLGLCAQTAGARHETAEVGAVLGAICGPALASHPGWRVPLLRQLAEGLGRGGSSLPDQLEKLQSPSSGLKAELGGFFAAAEKAAGDAALPEQQRIESVQLLGFAPLAEVSATLDALLDPKETPPLQLAAVRALSAHADPAIASTLLRRWPVLGPAVRPDVIDALFRRPDRLPALLDAIEAKKFHANELIPARRDQLLASADPAISGRAVKLLGKLETSDKVQLIDRYQQAVFKLTGDATRGQVVFHNTCSICHKPDQGSAPGPNLATLEDRSPTTLLVAILDPNREVKPSFVNFLITTRDGQDFSGVVINETATSITLRHPGGGEDTVLRANIRQLRSTGLSLMPDGLEATLSYQQMADLLRFLQTMKQ